MRDIEKEERPMGLALGLFFIGLGATLIMEFFKK